MILYMIGAANMAIIYIYIYIQLSYIDIIDIVGVFQLLFFVFFWGGFPLVFQLILWFHMANHLYIYIWCYFLPIGLVFHWFHIVKFWL